jgi:predicted metal-dependent hydrolase
MKILLVILILLNVYSLATLRQPENLRVVKEKYTTLLGNLPEKYTTLSDNRSIITGFHGTGKEIGYNVNKGYEIGLCVDGTPNEMLHVLIHELAHSTVDEYSHSDDFWKNFQELKEHCKRLGIYQDIPTSTKFCGKYIRD